MLNILGKSEDECCQVKTFDGVYYVKVDKKDTSSHGCIDSCVYEQLNNPGLRYCFRKGGAVPAKCSEGEPDLSLCKCMESFSSLTHFFC